jgi:hypothetical protein
MSPPLGAAERNLSPAPPAKRNAWYCPHGCKPRNSPMGHGQNADAARAAGIRHFLDVHDQPAPETT